jgi:hypothetical protein
MCGLPHGRSDFAGADLYAEELSHIRRTSADPDAVLLYLCHQCEMAAAEYDASTLALDACEAELDKIDPSVPDALFEGPRDHFLGLARASLHHTGRRWYGPVIESLETEFRRPLLGQESAPLSSEALVRLGVIIAAYGQWEAARHSAEEASGYCAAVARDNAARDRFEALATQIVALPAATLEGVRRKARLATWCFGGVDNLEMAVVGEGRSDVALTRSILRDLRTSGVE